MLSGLPATLGKHICLQFQVNKMYKGYIRKNNHSFLLKISLVTGTSDYGPNLGGCNAHIGYFYGPDKNLTFPFRMTRFFFCPQMSCINGNNPH